MHRIPPFSSLVTSLAKSIPLTMACLGFVLAGLAGCVDDGRKLGDGWNVSAIFAGHDPRPVGQQWTLLCLEALDTNRVRNCDDLADALRRVSHLDASRVNVAHEDEVSKIYYGTYYRKYDDSGQPIEPGQQIVPDMKVIGSERFGPEVTRDLRIIRSLAAGNSYPFIGARIVPKPSPDVGRPEWELSQCPGKYSLQVAVFYNTIMFGERKLAAAQYAEQLRGEGFEAYYHHGPTRSSVSVGHFGEEDVIREKGKYKFTNLGNRVRYSERVQALRNQKNGQFRCNLENGYEVRRIARVRPRTNTDLGLEEVVQESFLIPVPKKKAKAAG